MYILYMYIYIYIYVNLIKYEIWKCYIYINQMLANI